MVEDSDREALLPPDLMAALMAGECQSALVK